VRATPHDRPPALSSRAIANPTVGGRQVLDHIEVRGARENNLRDVSVDIPKRAITVFTGVSGSGKSSLVFGTIAAESQRLINETYTAFIQSFMPNVGRPEVDRRLHRAGVGEVPARRGGEGRDPRPEPQVRRPRQPLRAHVPGEGRRDRPAPHPAGDRARRDLRAMPGVRRRAAQRGRALREDPGPQHRRVRGDAGRRPRRVPGGQGRAERRAAARRPAPHARRPHRGRSRLPEPGPRVGDALRRRGAAREDGPPPRLEPLGRHVRLSTSRRSACTRTTCSASTGCWWRCATRATRCWSSSTSRR
jgi:pyruvate/2-oxoglutarate dehydrogenase complex dihydrolipoamide acyltransferase (E2) component